MALTCLAHRSTNGSASPLTSSRKRYFLWLREPSRSPNNSVYNRRARCLLEPMYRNSPEATSVRFISYTPGREGTGVWQMQRGHSSEPKDTTQNQVQVRHIFSLVSQKHTSRYISLLIVSAYGTFCLGPSLCDRNSSISEQKYEVL